MLGENGFGILDLNDLLGLDSWKLGRFGFNCFLTSNADLILPEPASDFGFSFRWFREWFYLFVGFLIWLYVIIAYFFMFKS